MHVQIVPESRRIERPPFVWLAVGIELFTGVLAIPVGWLFLTDPTGRSLGLPAGWIESTPFGSYFVPGLYLLIVNGFGMLALAAMSVARHWLAPWLTGALGVGLIIWILVQFAVMPETMILQPLFLGAGLIVGFVALFWLRRTRQLQLW
jgi:hypothetical protein